MSGVGRSGARTRTLRVAAGVGLPRRRTAYGHGRVWVEVLKRLRGLVKLDLIEPRYLPRVLPRRRADVWLINGHARPPSEVDGPAVAVFHEISWHVPELREHLQPDFAELHDRAGVESITLATRVLVPSRSSAADVVSAYDYDPGRIDMVPYGVDSTRFRPALRGGAELVARATGRPPAPYVLYVASLLPRKNLLSLREAMSQLAREGFPHLLVIVAAGSPDRADAQDLERQAEAELPGAPGRVVRIRPPLPERQLAALMAGASAFCLPSFYEGFGLVALEAMACGAPVVVSNGGSLPEVVEDAGIVVEPTPSAIASGLEGILSDPQKAAELSRAARARAERMTWEHVAESWLASL